MFITMGIVALVRFLCQMPIYGLETTATSTLLQYLGSMEIMMMLSGDMVGEVNAGSVGIGPYITASILIQILTVLIPRFQKLQRNGYSGTRTLKKYTLVVTGILAVIQSIFNLLSVSENTALSWSIIVISIMEWTVVAIIIALLGEAIQQHGMGNGFSIFITANIVARVFYEYRNISNSIISSDTDTWKMAVAIVVIVFLFVLFTYYLQETEIRIPIIETQTEGLKKMKGFVPIKINVSNIMPVVMTSTIFSLCQMITTIAGSDSVIATIFDMTTWYTVEDFYWLIGLGVYLLLLVVFTIFYAEYNFNPMEVADQLRRNGMYIENVKPGSDTVSFFISVLKKIRKTNILLLAILVLLPRFVMKLIGISYISLLGSSLVIVLQTLTEINRCIKAEAAPARKENHLFSIKKMNIFSCILKMLIYSENTRRK